MKWTVNSDCLRASHGFGFLPDWLEGVGGNLCLLVDGVDVMDLIGYIYYCITR
jgi:hypothetical protein